MQRECDHPVPSGKGRFCVGERRRYRICNTDPCPLNQPTFRAQQCSQYNNHTYEGKTYEWQPYFDQGKHTAIIIARRVYEQPKGNCVHQIGRQVQLLGIKKRKRQEKMNKQLLHLKWYFVICLIYYSLWLLLSFCCLVNNVMRHNIISRISWIYTVGRNLNFSLSPPLLFSLRTSAHFIQFKDSHKFLILNTFKKNEWQEAF